MPPPRPLMRIFLAVFPPAAVQRAAHEVIAALRQPADGVSWVKPANLHYTLRFIGEIGADGVRRVTAAARDAVAGRAAFAAALDGLGAFPNPRRAGVVWIGLAEGGEALVALARALERALEARGFGRPDHPFSAHLTIGRVRTPGPDWTERLAAAPGPDWAERLAAARFTVDRLCVVESQLSPTGSIYTVRAAAALKRGVG